MKFLQAVVQQLFGVETHANSIKPVGGGCIHQAGVFQHHNENYFIKWNKGASEMFEVETRGLALLRQTESVHVPEVIGQGTVENTGYLCLEFIESSDRKVGFWEDFGHALAKLHSQTSSSFGLDHDNFIGSLPQSNSQHSNGVDFFICERLVPQLKLASKKGLISRQLYAQFDLLFEKLPSLIPTEQSSLLHGDLWSGNFMVGSQGQPIVFDPAVYYGHREAELAFTKMFGGFDDKFYESYNEAFPLSKGHEERVDIFNLYPLLVHVNLFGVSYLSGIQRTLSRFA